VNSTTSRNHDTSALSGELAVSSIKDCPAFIPDAIEESKEAEKKEKAASRKQFRNPVIFSYGS